MVYYNDNPTITDTVQFDLYTTDTAGNPVDPYMVNNVTIYFISRDYTTDTYYTTTQYVAGQDTSFIYSDALPFKIFGTDDYPAWLSTDTPDALIQKIQYDSNGSPELGHFYLEWTPELANEGDYFVCYTWTPVPAGDSISKSMYFNLRGTRYPSSPPSHQTKPEKYKILLERYLPEMFKLMLGDGDLTPDVLHRTNLAVAKGFTDVENMSNQLLDILDANVVKDTLLPYMANYFRWSLKSQDPVLWRRQCRRAIPLYKKKGTISGLREALDECGIHFKKLTHYWQVTSKATWQEGLVYEGSATFTLAKIAKLPPDQNYQVAYRKTTETTYTVLDPSTYVFANESAANENCPPTDDLYTTLTLNDDSFLDVGDIVFVRYRVGTVDNQTLETYIQGLPLSDNRDEMQVTYPVKNWNVRLIAEDDPLLDMICSEKHPFQYPVVWGKLRTEFAYSENIYNMDEYNGSVRDSTDPCDIDASFYDVCSCCRSTQVSVDVAVEQLSNDRLTEAADVIQDFLPFHCPVHSINYTGLNDELILPPLEVLECLINAEMNDDIIVAQFDFNRIIEDGTSDASELTREMLADATTVATGTGTGANSQIYLSAGIDYKNFPIATDNLLEIQGGPQIGDYSLNKDGSVDGLDPTTLSTAGFGFRFSNVHYAENGVSIYQANQFTFSPANDLTILPIDSTWQLRINSGPNAGTYPINLLLPSGQLSFGEWEDNAVSGLSYSVLTPTNVVAVSGTGNVDVRNVGRIETSNIRDEWDVVKGDYIRVENPVTSPPNQQYQIINDVGDNAFLIDGWTGGDQVGSVNYKTLRRVYCGYGTLAYKGMVLTTGTNYESSLGIQNGSNPVSDPVEGSDFIQNYLVQINGLYFGVSGWDGDNIYLNGPVQSWGLSGTSVNYTLIQFVKIPFYTQQGKHFNFIDRRTDGVVELDQSGDQVIPVLFRMQELNRASRGEGSQDSVKTKENIWYTVETK